MTAISTFSQYKQKSIDLKYAIFGTMCQVGKEKLSDRLLAP